MLYRSTRDSSDPPTLLSFREAVLSGLAPDGGLYIPTTIPSLPGTFLAEWQTFTFQQLCLALFPYFVDQQDVSSAELKNLVDKSYSTFSHPEITPVRPFLVEPGQDDLYRNLWLLELFHGPTLAFKDVALQFLGNLFELFLRKTGGKDRLTVVGATSGDTGGAAIYGLKGKQNIDVFILHPLGRVSLVQEAQMTTILDENVYNVAVEGTFDDCQVCYQN
jgi:threonine synthase